MNRFYWPLLAFMVGFNAPILNSAYKTLRPFVVAACAGTLAGCGHFLSLQKTTYPPELKPFMVRYIDAKITYLNVDHFYKPILITFGEIEDSDTVATCTNFGFKGRIIIDREYWDNASFYSRLTLVYHELGHCDLNYMFHVPATIMNSSVLGAVNDRTIDFYTEQLFDSKFMRDNKVSEECTLKH